MPVDQSTCKHLWTLTARDESSRSLILRCDRCKVRGVVPDPSVREWELASYAAARPYRWNKKLNSRVEVQIAEVVG